MKSKTKTECEWKTSEEGNLLFIRGINENENTAAICSVHKRRDDNGLFNEEHKANADRIVKSVNMHDDLVDALGMWMKCNGSTEWARTRRSSMENQAYDRTNELLKSIKKYCQ